MKPVDAYMIIRDGKPVHVRFTKESADACKSLEERTFFHDKVEVVPVVIVEKTDNE